MAAEQNKLLVSRLVEEAVNRSNLDVLDEVADGEIALAARHWIGPFRDSFPDFRMEIIDLTREGLKKRKESGPGGQRHSSLGGMVSAHSRGLTRD